MSRRSSHEIIQSILAAARRHLDMEVAHFSEFVDGAQVIRQVEGDAESFGLAEGTRIDLDGTYCQRMALGRIPNLVSDVTDHPELRDLDVTRRAGIGAYVGTRVELADGRLYGTLCCLSHHADRRLRQRDADFLAMLAQLAAESIERTELEEKAWRLQLEAEGIEALLAALEARDGYTRGHSDAVLDVAIAVAKGLDLAENEIDEVAQVARLHDVGKMGVPDAILRKPGPLDAYEWRLMREHPVIGARIVGAIAALKHLAPAIRAEHERWDGTGYPDGKAGTDIPVASRIVLVCDAYHAMVSDRPYRKAMSPELARRELVDKTGRQFWADAVEVLLEVLGEQAASPAEPPGRAAHVLVVDDDPDVRQLLRFSLETDRAFTVAGEAGDGAEAVAFVAQERPDAVILDLSMPVMDGIQAIPKIKAVSPTTAILVFSASDDQHVQGKALEAGADAFLPKGAAIGDVNDRLMQVVNGRRYAGPGSSDEPEGTAAAG